MTDPIADTPTPRDELEKLSDQELIERLRGVGDSTMSWIPAELQRRNTRELATAINRGQGAARLLMFATWALVVATSILAYATCSGP